MDLRAHLTVVRRSWLLLAIPLVLGLAAALVVLALQTPKYQSTAKVYVSVGNATNANDLSQANSFAQSAAANFAALAQQPYVLQAVRQELRLPLSADRIAKEMTTTVEQDTSIIAIDLLDPSPARAADIANATARQLAIAVAKLNPSAADGTQSVKVTVVRTAVVAQDATVPNRSLGVALGVLGGLLLGVLLVILRELLDTRVRTTAELQHLTAAPTVGEIPRATAIVSRPLVMVDEPGSAAAEGFRVLQMNTEYLRAPDGVAVIGIASAVPSEGKSTVAANLAIALAAAGHRVALVDADLRRPRLHAILGVDNGLGLTEVLVGRVDVLDAVQSWGGDGHRLAVLPAGATPPNPGELLQSPRFRAALDRLAAEADVVVVDGPPLLAVADSAVIAHTVDAVLLVASLQRSHRVPVARAVVALESVGARVLGSVATMTRPARADSDAYLRYSDGRKSGSSFRRRMQDRFGERQRIVPGPAGQSGSFDAASDVEPAVALDRRSAPEPRDAAAGRSMDEGPRTGRELVEASHAAAARAREQPPTVRPVRVPPAHADARQMKVLRRHLSPEQLRILRGFPSPTRPDPS